jgi:Amt family ammonium transporter
LTLVTTSIAAAAGGVFAAILSTMVFKNLDLTMFLNGILGGLVGITAGADQMSPADAVLIGAIAGLLIVAAVSFFDRLKLDDPVGAIAVHLVCGIWGTLAVGLFGALASLDQFLSQLTGVASYAIACVLVSLLILGTLKVTLGIRVGEKEELEGLDIHEHGMSAYSN